MDKASTHQVNIASLSNSPLLFDQFLFHMNYFFFAISSTIYPRRDLQLPRTTTGEVGSTIYELFLFLSS